MVVQHALWPLRRLESAMNDRLDGTGGETPPSMPNRDMRQLAGSIWSTFDASKRTDQHMRAIVDGATDAILTIDRSGTIVQFNPGAERMFGIRAGEAVGRARGAESVVVRQLMREVWDGVFEVLTLEEVSGRPGAMVVPDEAIFHEDDHDFVLQRLRQGERVILRRLRVRVGDRDEDTGVTTIEEPTDRLTRGAEVHRAERTERFYVDLYGKLGSFHDDLERAPRTLQDVRTLLYWAAVMLDAPLCQGNVKARAAAAFTQAKAYHDTARRQLLEGRTVDAVRRMQEAMRRISTAAAEIARSCAEGQIEIGVTPPHLPVRPEDKAEIEGTQPETRP